MLRHRRRRLRIQRIDARAEPFLRAGHADSASQPFVSPGHADGGADRIRPADIDDPAGGDPARRRTGSRAGRPGFLACRTGGINPSGNEAWDFLSPSALPGQCEPIGEGVTECHPWPIMRLEAGSIVVAVRSYGMPGSKPPTGGKPITVSGQPARWIVGPAGETCREIGGSVADTIVITGHAGGGWLSLDGCLAGPKTAAAERVFSALVRSLKVVQ